MSRIQQILDKAERDGYSRQLRGVDPVAPSAPHSYPGEPGPVAAGLVPSRLVSGAFLSPALITADARDTVAVEQYRALRTRVQANGTNPARVLLVTSPNTGDGKTITASNLALAMAQEQKRRICLVEADFRRPCLQELFGLPDGPGLGEVLAGEVELRDALIELEEHQLTVLPAGRVPARPSDQLGTINMRRTVDLLRTHHDRVVIDAPAVTPLADVNILSALVDGVLLVVRAGVTSKPAIREAIAALDRAKLLGLVLNEST
jgi:capsular exopolysaccharide synthesis family protein